MNNFGYNYFMVISYAVKILNYYSSYLTTPQAILCMVFCVLAFCLALMIALSFHEMAHAFAAKINGDLTAKYEGRLTPNPFKHFDPIGMLMMFLVGFGWAKPVPVNPSNFNNHKKGLIETSIAGVLTNLIFAVIFSLLYLLFALIPTPSLDNSMLLYLWLFCDYFLYFGVIFNINFFLFNLIPLFPLDGFRLWDALFPRSKILEFLYKYGSLILIGLIVFGYVTENFFGVNLSPLNLYISYVGTWIRDGLFAFWGLFGL